MDIMRIIATALALLVTYVQSQDDDQASVLCGNTWDTVGKAAMDVDYVTKFSVIRSMAAYFCTRDPVMFQVWRPLGGLTFELVWEYPLQPPVLVPGVKKVDLHPDFHFPVEQIFRVGFAPMSNKSLPMGKNFFPQNQGSVIVSAENAYPTTFIRGQVYRFIELVFPYKFSGALCNDTADSCELPDISTPSRPLLNETTDPALPNFNGSVTTTVDPTDPFNIPGPLGPIGLPGITGNIGPDGVQGPKGPGGDTGDRGPQGKAGPQGPVGRKGLTAASIQGETCSECTGFKNPNLILGMLIWALLLSFLIVMMLVLATQRPKIAS